MDGIANIPIKAWELALNDESELWSSKGAVEAIDRHNVKNKSHYTESWRTNDEDVIAKKVKSAVKDSLTNELSTLVESDPKIAK